MSLGLLNWKHRSREGTKIHKMICGFYLGCLSGQRKKRCVNSGRFGWSQKILSGQRFFGLETQTANFWQTIKIGSWLKNFGKPRSGNRVCRRVYKSNWKLEQCKIKSHTSKTPRNAPGGVLWSDESIVQIVFGNRGYRVLSSKVEKGPPRFVIQRKI